MTIPFDFNNPMSRGRSYPFAAGLDMSKVKPMLGAQLHTPNAVPATAKGIANVKRAMKLPAGIAASYNKKKTDCDPGEVSSRGVCKKKGRKKKASQDNSGQRLSSAGEESGVKYKIDTEGDKTGQSAFDTLDNYMKKAGLNSFQSNFFSRLVLEGADIEGAIKQAEDRFGEKVASELKSGFETLEKDANWLKAIGQGAWNLGKKYVPKLFSRGAAKQVATEAGEQAVKRIAPRAGQIAGESTSRALIPYTGLAKVKPTMGQKALEAGKQFFTGGGALKQFGEGSVQGVMNPFTGLMSNQAFDDEGNIRFGHLLGQGLLGGLGRRGLGSFKGLNQANVSGALNRASAGAGTGYAAGLGANLAGFDVDPITLSRLGYGGGAMLPKNLSGLQAVKNMKPGKLKDFLSRDLGTKSFGRGIDPLSATDPFGVASGAIGAGAGKLFNAAKPYVAPAGQAIARGYKSLSTPAQAALMAGGAGTAGVLGTGAYLGNKMDQQAEQFRQELQPYLDGAAYTMNRTNEFMDNPIGGMLGGLGDTFQQNPWLLPLLLGGGGAALGGMAGGGTGATLGGIGLPLLYMMSQGKGLGDLFPGSQQNVAATQQQMTNQDEATRAAQQAQNPVATQNTEQQDEFARQQAQQFAEANPGMMDGGWLDFTGYDQDEMAQLFAKASPQQQRILQDPSVPEDIKGKILEVIAQG